MKKCLILVTLLCCLSGVLPVMAGPYIVQGPFVAPLPGSMVPAPGNVPGKEYAAGPNHDQFGVATVGQSLLWDGAGGIQNGILYPGGEVDAMANYIDALYQPVVSNNSVLVFAGYNMFNHNQKAQVLFERPDGSFGIWATGPNIDQHMTNDDDIVGLEVWGPEQIPDANRYSLMGDPNGCAVNVLGGGCLVPTAMIAGFLNVNPTDLDLDALMVDDPLNRILFSIRPIAGMYDGGEIWDFNYLAGTGAFLNHGGHLWDTNFGVQARFGGLGMTGEDVGVLEAVSYIPEPSSFYLTLAAAAIVLYLRRRR